jgi:hypothetical protein
MAAKTLTYGNVGAYLLFVCGDRPFLDREWNAYIEFLRKTVYPGMEPRSLVVAGSAGPTAWQRKELNELMATFENPRVAVVTRSAIARGIVKALTLFTPAYRTFSPERLEDAFKHLGVGGADLAMVRRLLASLQKELEG